MRADINPQRKKELAEKRRRYEARLQGLKNERASWDSHYRELAENFLPRRIQLDKSAKNSGKKLNDKLINNTPLIAGRTLSAGMMGGKTSPARPWFQLSTADPKLAKAAPVKEWLHDVAGIIRDVCGKSNIYNAFAISYLDLGIFGTSAKVLEEDDKDVIRAYSFPVGTYWLSSSARQSIDTMFREFTFTVGQVVEKFGEENCTPSVCQAFNKGGAELETKVDIVHVIEPNLERVHGRLDYRGKKFSSCWYEKSSGPEAGFLREAGYDRFPVLAPRWDLNADDVYGRSPAMDALGDAKMLQLLEKRKAELVDKLSKPPIKVPGSMRNARVSTVPGDITAGDETQGGTKIEPLFMVDPQALPAVEASILRTEERINIALYARLWLMMDQLDRKQITAREIDERHEEKLLQLGPVLERIDDEMLDPFIEWVFWTLFERGMLPLPPEELQGMELKIEYTSMLSQAQKALGISGVRELATFGLSLAGVKEDVLDKFNFDGILGEYASRLGTRPDLLRSDEEMEELRNAKAQMAQQQMAMQQAAQAAESAKTLSQTSVDGDNGLTRLLSSIGGGPG